MSKGSIRRPSQIPREQEATNWQRTFGQHPDDINNLWGYVTPDEEPELTEPQHDDT